MEVKREVPPPEVTWFSFTPEEATVLLKFINCHGNELVSGERAGDLRSDNPFMYELAGMLYRDSVK